MGQNSRGSKIAIKSLGLCGARINIVFVCILFCFLPYKDGSWVLDVGRIVTLNLGVVDREWALCVRHQISLPPTI